VNRKKVEALLPLLGTKVTGHRNSWVEGYCPFGPWKHDGGKSHAGAFAIQSSDTKRSVFKCFSCNMRGDLMHLQVELANWLRQEKTPIPGYNLSASLELIANEFDGLEFDPDIPDWQDVAPSDTLFLPESWLSSFHPVLECKDGADYLHTRDVPDDVALALDVRYDTVQRRVCFPFRDPSGRLVGMQGRDITGHSKLRYYFYPYKKTVNKHYWLGEDKVDFDHPVVLVEGPFDFASVYRAYSNVLASFSVGISSLKMSRIGDASEFVTFYDAGKGGDSARLAIEKAFPRAVVTHVVPTNEGGDPGSMSWGEVFAHLSQHLPMG
jgi:hypothetical protein